ncbi:hypothetical protein EG329_000082 [Mollisiaceae sp. DMI_Dod_QoI]|nr:hypothetical protein EG329_000082 [Helotiales sp. DMI_Dod_QoI]
MKYSLATLALSGLVSAATLPRDSCSCKFSLTASGGQSGVVGQLSDGQNRIGGGNPTGEYCINNGQITDSQGRGCILTPTTQFQCDVGATPTGGFSLGSNGEVEYNGSQTFYACPASDDMYNIYTTPVSGQTKCVQIQLTASGCYAQSSSAKPVSSTAQTSQQQSATEQTSQQTTQPQTQTSVQTVQSSCPAPQTVTNVQTATTTVTMTAQQSCPAAQTSTVTQTVEKTAQASCPAPSTVTVTQPASQSASQPASSQPASSQPASQPPTTTSSSSPSAPSSTGKSCPTDLSGQYQYPHLIVPVSKSQPDKVYGTSYNGTITSDISSIYNFDIPSSYTGSCSLVFLFPTQDQLETSSYSFAGNGEFDFAQLSTIASQTTDYSNMGSVKTDFGTKTATPGSSVVVSTFSCPAGQTVTYEISSVSGSTLNYFQDYNPSPIGLYITSC